MRTIVGRCGYLWGQVGDFMFMGEYHHNIDTKKRIIIPFKFRSELGDNFVLTRGLDNCLFIYSQVEWQNIITKYKSLPNIKEARNFMRFFLSGAVECQLDKQGRIKIPHPLTKYASLEKECIIIGVNDRLEIWSKDKWEQFIIENEDNLSEMADSLFASDLS